MCMMMMMMTLMKTCQFPRLNFVMELDKFYQPNSGLRGSKNRGRGYIYT